MERATETKILDGNRTAGTIRNEIAEKVAEMRASGKRLPHLAAVLVGTDGSGETYVRFKVKDCLEVGFQSTLVRRPVNITEEELLELVADLNADPEVDGFIVQLPLPPHIDPDKVIMAIDPKKDVDGFHPANVGRMVLGLEGFLPATPMGIIELCRRNGVEIAGKHVVVIGRSNIVGTPLSILLSRKREGGNATVTLCHTGTRDLAAHTRRADIIVSAAGVPDIITADMVKPGAAVLDVGVARRDGKIAGDVHPDVAEVAGWLTPNPGGVGPMTRAMLLANVVEAAERAAGTASAG